MQSSDAHVPSPSSSSSLALLAGFALRGNRVASTSRAALSQCSYSYNVGARNASTLPTSSSSNIKGKGRVSPSQRELPLRKQYLFEQYKHVLTTSPVIIFLKPGDFTVAELTTLRVDLSLIPGAPSTSTTAQAINDASLHCNGQPRLMYLRPGLLKPTFKTLRHLPAQAVLDNLEQEGGRVAVLVMDSLHPPTLKATLAAVKKLSSSPNVRKLQAAAAAAAAKGGAGSKGGKAAGAAAKPAAGAVDKQQAERMRVIAALFDGKAATREEVERVSTLPSIEELYAQLVGLLEMPARSVIGMTARAGGEDLVRTLEGFGMGLEQAGQSSSEKSARCNEHV